MAKLSQQQPQKNNASNDNNNKNLNATKNLTTKVKRTRRSVPRDSPPQRSSIYRGVTRHRWTGRYEAHLWDKNCWNESQNKKGRQVYLGAYDDEETAAHAYDLAALKYWGQETTLNFPLPTYENEVREMDDISREEYIGSLRRKSSGFSRGISKYRGVARHHHNGRWEARIGRVFGNKYLYLGTYATQEEAAKAYDIAAIEYRGLNAITNFDLSHYINWLKPNNNDTNIIKYNIVDSNPIVCDRNITPYPNQEMGCNFFNNQEKSFKNGEDQTTMTQTRLADAASTLGLLMTSNSTLLESELLSCIFPDEIQTYFDCEDYSKYGESDDLMFNELESYLPPIFHFDDFDICLK